MRFGVFLLVAAVRGDVYMQYPPGSNNRLDEGGGNRNNNNRLMDTQNNAKGGYGYGGSANNQAASVSYMAGSKLSVAWTSQHSCGSENAECQIVIQYMCNDGNGPPPGVIAANDPNQPQGVGEGPLRDGDNNNSPDPDNPQLNRGLHEPTAFYQACNNRERNKGLYTSDQNLNADDATRTRQNPNGGRSGLECPEERDYYPYWAPSPWKDLMVMTNNLAMCSYYQQNSQNVASRGYCTGGSTGNNNNLQPNNQAQCTASGGQWLTVPPFGIAQPACVAAPVTRDNHLGNDATGNEVFANLTIPVGAGGASDVAQACAVRLRYNITTADTRACSISTFTTRETCEQNNGIWSSFYVDASMNDNTLNSQPPLPDGNPKVTMGGFLASSNTINSKLELAVNTNQYGRTFQDRSHAFSIEPRPAAVPSTANIYNLNVKGKRGNIVQTYPATEYDFHPVDLVVGRQDYVHVQWTGNDNTNNNGNNNGEGTNNEDRHNIVQLDNAGLDVPAPQSQANMFDVAWEWNPEPVTNTNFGGSRSRTDLTKQFALSKQTNCNANPNNDQQRSNCEKLNRAAPTVNLGLLRFKPGEYRYMSSRNNNFSNRAQKAKITTLTEPAALPQTPTHVVATPIDSGNANRASMQVTWSPPGEAAPYVGTNGQTYSGYAQEARVPIAYTVQYSCDGGQNWVPTNCENTQLSCRIDALPAGTPCAFQVRSGTTGGWSTASETAVAVTTHNEQSRECAQRMIDMVNGNYLSPGAVAGIVIAVIAGVALALCLVWYFLCGGAKTFQPSPPPPPPGGKYDIPPPPPPGSYPATY